MDSQRFQFYLATQAKLVQKSTESAKCFDINRNYLYNCEPFKINRFKSCWETQITGQETDEFWHSFCFSFIIVCCICLNLSLGANYLSFGYFWWQFYYDIVVSINFIFYFLINSFYATGNTLPYRHLNLLWKNPFSASFQHYSY